MAIPAQSKIIKASLIHASVNTVVNGTINYFMIRGKDVHVITSDSITNSTTLTRLLDRVR